MVFMLTRFEDDIQTFNMSIKTRIMERGPSLVIRNSEWFLFFQKFFQGFRIIVHGSMDHRCNRIRVGLIENVGRRHLSSSLTRFFTSRIFFLRFDLFCLCQTRVASREFKSNQDWVVKLYKNATFDTDML